MLVLNRLVTVNAPLQPVFDYLADFTTTNEWAPRSTEARRCHGDGGPGTVYTCVVSFLGRRTPMTYRLTCLEAPRRIEWSGRSKAVLATSTVRLGHLPTGTTTVDCTTTFSYPDLPPLSERLLRAPLDRFCDDAREGLETTLRSLAATRGGFTSRAGTTGRTRP